MRMLKKVVAITGLAAVAAAAPAAASTTSTSAPAHAKVGITHVVQHTMKAGTDTWPL